MRFGNITQDRLEEFLLEYGFKPLELELNYLMERFDWDWDGVISYTEFVDELTPHSAF